ncbi:DUF1573 domain-containing protein [Rhodocytophaga rosea]|uniref:DUF1573 domain-containing protein n=1 Tax=Rhodocytophaga rosea TaxID=2704465 RepID=A0A6C0GP69_9BACT|nr:DUF1573 domain-containing protein [Rhodocytophaga rosea]QHT69836.1 DUF1573 domain-containing protein [Rhodocytophaga rosea]
MKKIFMNYLLTLATAGILFSCNTEAKRTSEEGASTTAAEVKTTSQEQPADGAQAAATNPADAPVISFEETSYDFGTIQDGDVVKHTFAFTNTGKSPLIIQNASAQCGCTVPDWPREPIAPGAKGEIKVEFNSKGKAGVQSKAVTVTSNTANGSDQVILKGIVESGVASMKGPYKTN